MPITVQSIFDQARIKYKDMTQTLYLQYLNEVYKDAIYNFRLIVDQDNINLVSGTREYAISERTVRVWVAAIAESATSATVLNMTTERALDATYPGWMYQSAGYPSDCYIAQTTTGSKSIGLYPTPTVTTSGTYPRLELQVSKEPATDLTIVDSLPEVVRDRSPWVFGVCAKHAYLHDPEAYEDLYQKFLREMALSESKMRQILADATAAPKTVPWVKGTWRPY